MSLIKIEWECVPEDFECDLRKAVAKHVLWLKEMRRTMERGIQTGEMRFN